MPPSCKLCSGRERGSASLRAAGGLPWSQGLSVAAGGPLGPHL